MGKNKSYPDIETLIKLSDKFDISLDILLKEDKIMIKEIDKERKNYKFEKNNRLYTLKVFDKVKLEKIINQGYKIYKDLYSCKLCK